MFPPRWKSIVEGEGWLFAAPGMFDPAGNQETKGALLIPLVTNGTRTQQVLGALSRIYRISMMEREREREREVPQQCPKTKSYRTFTVQDVP